MKPLSSFARERRKALSGLSQNSFSQSAEEWLAEILFEPEIASARPLFKISNPELIDILNLPDRYSAKNIYSFNDLSPAMDSALPQIEAARKKEKRFLIENQLLDLYGRTAEFFQLRRSLLLVLPIFSLPGDEARAAGMEPDRAYNYMEMIRFRKALQRQIKKGPAEKPLEEGMAIRRPSPQAPPKKTLAEGGHSPAFAASAAQKNPRRGQEKYQRLFALSYKLSILDKEAETRTENDIFKIIPSLWAEDGELWRSPRELFASGKGGPQSADYMRAYAEAARALRACRAGGAAAGGGKNAGNKAGADFTDKKAPAALSANAIKKSAPETQSKKPGGNDLNAIRKSRLSEGKIQYKRRGESEPRRDCRKIFKTAGDNIYQAALKIASASPKATPPASPAGGDLSAGAFLQRAFARGTNIRPGLLLMEKFFNDIQFFEKSLFLYLAAFLLTLFSFLLAPFAVSPKPVKRRADKAAPPVSDASGKNQGVAAECAPDDSSRKPSFLTNLNWFDLFLKAAFPPDKGGQGGFRDVAFPDLFRKHQTGINRGAFYRLSFFSLCGGLFLHASGTVFQTIVQGRPPVSNLYESILFVGLVIVAFFVYQERKKRNGQALFSAAAAGSILQFVGVQTKGDEVVNLLVPVLNSHFWLSSHVLCICIGYGCAVTASLQGHGFLFSNIFSRFFREKQENGFSGKTTFAETKEMKTPLVYSADSAESGRPQKQAPDRIATDRLAESRPSANRLPPADRISAGTKSLVFQQASGALFAALFFCLFGTVLGGIWADQSWGRFWGWDPKENGALMIILSLLALVHGAEAGILREKGLAAGLILLNIAVALSWFGVNLLNVGLHSYGFSEGAFWGLAVFCAAEAALAALSLLLIKNPARP